MTAMTSTLNAIEHAGLDQFSDDLNPRFVFSLTHKDVLLSALRGEISLEALVKIELSSRGLDTNGKFVGFNKAREIHGVPNVPAAR